MAQPDDDDNGDGWWTIPTLRTADFEVGATISGDINRTTIVTQDEALVLDVNMEDVIDRIDAIAAEEGYDTAHSIQDDLDIRDKHLEVVIVRDKESSVLINELVDLE